MRPKEKKIFETLFRIKGLLEHLEEQVLITENEKDQQIIPQEIVDKVFPIRKAKKKKLGRPPGKKKKK